MNVRQIFLLDFISGVHQRVLTTIAVWGEKKSHSFWFRAIICFLMQPVIHLVFLNYALYFIFHSYLFDLYGFFFLRSWLKSSLLYNNLNWLGLLFLMILSQIFISVTFVTVRHISVVVVSLPPSISRLMRPFNTHSQGRILSVIHV